MLAYNNLIEVVQLLPVFVSVIYILCIFVPLKFRHYSGVFMTICALIVSLGYSIIARDYLEWHIAAVWILISLIVGWQSYNDYKTFKYFKKIEYAIINEVCITKLLYEGKYEPYERPECDD